MQNCNNLKCKNKLDVNKANKHKIKFCSVTCQTSEWRRINTKPKADLYGKNKCDECGKKYDKVSSINRFCSHKCLRKLHGRLYHQKHKKKAEKN